QPGGSGGVGPVDVDVLRAVPDAPDEELARLPRVCDLAVHHAGRVEDEVADLRCDGLPPTGPAFDTDAAGDHVDVRVALAVMVPVAGQARVGADPADPSVAVLEQRSTLHPRCAGRGCRLDLGRPDDDWSITIHRSTSARTPSPAILASRASG